MTRIGISLTLLLSCGCFHAQVDSSSINKCDVKTGLISDKNDIDYYYLPKDFHPTHGVDVDSISFADAVDLAKRLTESGDNLNALHVLQRILNRIEPSDGEKYTDEYLVGSVENLKNAIKTILINPDAHIDLETYGVPFTHMPNWTM